MNNNADHRAQLEKRLFEASAELSGTGIDKPLDPDAPREGRLASLKTRGLPAVRGSSSNITFKPKLTQRKKRDGTTDSLLQFNDDALHKKAARGRNAGNPAGRGRVKAEPILSASGPFAQGPADSPAVKRKTVASSRNLANGSSSTSSAGKTSSAKLVLDDEVNFDDDGRPMRNLNRLRHSDDHWAPITTERIEREIEQGRIAVPESSQPTIKIEPGSPNENAGPVVSEPSRSPAAKFKEKDVTTKNKPAEIRVLNAEEAEEHDRMTTDAAFLRMTLDTEEMKDENQMFFIQLPEILPLWRPEADVKEEPIKEEVKPEVIEVNQRDEEKKEVMHESEPAQIRKKKARPIAFPPPEGLLGQLHVHKSGKLSCTWGGIRMDVGRGSECSFLQDVVAMETKTDKKAWVLGRITSRMLMIPQLDDLL